MSTQRNKRDIDVRVPLKVKNKLIEIAKKSERTLEDIIVTFFSVACANSKHEAGTLSDVLIGEDISITHRHVINIRIPSRHFDMLNDIAWELNLQAKKSQRGGGGRLLGLCAISALRLRTAHEWVKYFKSGEDLISKITETTDKSLANRETKHD